MRTTGLCNLVALIGRILGGLRNNSVQSVDSVVQVEYTKVRQVLVHFVDNACFRFVFDFEFLLHSLRQGLPELDSDEDGQDRSEAKQRGHHSSHI